MVNMQKAGQPLTKTLFPLGAMARKDRPLKQFLLNCFRKLGPNLYDGSTKRLGKITVPIGSIRRCHHVLQFGSS